MGNDDNSPTKRVTGGSLPALVWKDVMEEAHKGLDPRVLPGRMSEPEPTVAVVEPDSSLYGEEEPVIEQEAVQPVPRKKKKRGLLARIFGHDDVGGGQNRKVRRIGMDGQIY